MSDRKKTIILGSTPMLEPVIIDAEPESIQIDLKRTAIMVVDVQNAFASEGGFFDLWGVDISKNQKIFQPIRKMADLARAKNVKVLYVAHRYSPDYHDAGNWNSPNWYKSADVYLLREHPEWRDKFCTRGTWGAEIVDDLKPATGEIIVEKHRYSAFIGTNLDQILKSFEIRYLILTGLATNVCVESTLRDAYFFEYFPILVSDAVAEVGPPFIREATEFTVKLCFGWVTNSTNIIESLK